MITLLKVIGGHWGQFKWIKIVLAGAGIWVLINTMLSSFQP